jgi:Limonene-1,2-epoxide hydrolase
MPTPVEIVRDFCACWGESREALRDSFRRYLTPNAVWENVGLSVTTGPDEAIALLDSFETSVGIVTIKVDMLAIVADGSRVLTERIDRMVDANGVEHVNIRLMGIFELEGDRISVWRDYFDSAVLTPPAG